MICNRADLDAAIDWLRRENITDSASFMMNDNEIHTYRGFVLWRSAPARRKHGWYLLSHSFSMDPFIVAPWVVDEVASFTDRATTP